MIQLESNANLNRSFQSNFRAEASLTILDKYCCNFDLGFDVQIVRRQRTFGDEGSHRSRPFEMVEGEESNTASAVVLIGTVTTCLHRRCELEFMLMVSAPRV